jgi:hypothetical protein
MNRLLKEKEIFSTNKIVKRCLMSIIKEFKSVILFYTQWAKQKPKKSKIDTSKHCRGCRFRSLL